MVFRRRIYYMSLRICNIQLTNFLPLWRFISIRLANIPYFTTSQFEKSFAAHKCINSSICAFIRAFVKEPWTIANGRQLRRRNSSWKRNQSSFCLADFTLRCGKESEMIVRKFMWSCCIPKAVEVHQRKFIKLPITSNSQTYAKRSCTNYRFFRNAHFSADYVCLQRNEVTIQLFLWICVWKKPIPNSLICLMIMVENYHRELCFKHELLNSFFRSFSSKLWAFDLICP